MTEKIFLVKLTKEDIKRLISWFKGLKAFSPDNIYNGDVVLLKKLEALK